MTTPRIHPRTPTRTWTRTWTRTAIWHFVRHYLEMIVAMVLGMVILGPLESALLSPLGWSSLHGVPELDALVMATNMTVAMVAWMRYRGHGWAATNEMALAMYLPFIVLFPPLWLGFITPATMLTGGHLLMLPAMAGAMLLRRNEYTGHQHQHQHQHQEDHDQHGHHRNDQHEAAHDDHAHSQGPLVNTPATTRTPRTL